MKKIFILALLVILGIGGFWLAGDANQAIQEKPQIGKVTLGATASVTSSPSFTTPQTLSIPKINVKAQVESVGMDKEGRMATPADADNVAWYNLGFKPGAKGSAVFAGHFDKEPGDPAVFWDINKLATGDEVIATDTKGKSYTYEVIKAKKYPYDQFPLQEVFGQSKKAMLNLITCQGDWDTNAKNYSHRIVVYTQLKE